MLTLDSVSVTRGGVPVLDDVSLALGRGQAVVLRGPNGSGKTTLLRTVAGLQPPAAGRIEGAEHVAYAGHADGLKASLSAAENLRFWASAFGTHDILPALAAFDLEALADRRAGEMSAGQKRRLGLARMLVTGRPVWVLDEPTVSLDTTSVGLFAKAVSDHLEKGGAALIATHIDLGLPDSRTLDVTPYRARPRAAAADEAFL
ncbi:heme ABC exporter ATP-binding protein CcmA [Roseivivax marinus]|uniref:heme ABC exporter ATP-binding protein CcmA n=1 Tax=Roseivivax marinus TaxID=1379903 RepID=UPI001F04A18A|nr:heme ABC exporter ATP-binding protein CcmA [Roseivivax marinus]UMA66261.1 heme ABC exporter ATP-binding protein CcmA [Roseivivax marinus]